MKKLDIAKAKLCLAEIPEKVLPILKKYRAFLCGGAVLSSLYEFPTNDYDLYFECEVDRYNCYIELLSVGANISWNSKNAISISYENKKLQLIGCFYGNPEEILSSFDFNICQIGLRLDSEEVLHVQNYPSFYYPNVTLNPKYSRKLDLRRVEKYKSRGFSFDKNSVKNYVDRKLGEYY